jgi:hypothetical protein
MSLMSAPNNVWCADFKGQFRTRDGVYCYPLTVTDGFSRYLLGCQSLLSTAHVGAKPVFERLFREHGLPRIIRTDNGVPFATNAIARLSELSVWWIRLGIQPELIEPTSRQQNGRHERMHRTLKAETTQPPAGDLRAQQRRFNDFQTVYNGERPHDGIGQQTPATLYMPSDRAYPCKLPPLEYPSHFERRLVSRNGGLRWNPQLGQRQPHSWRRIRGPGRDRPRPLHCLLRAAGARSSPRARTHNRGYLRSNQSEESVTYVPGLICYLSPRPLTIVGLAQTACCEGSGSSPAVLRGAAGVKRKRILNPPRPQTTTANKGSASSTTITICQVRRGRAAQGARRCRVRLPLGP